MILDQLDSAGADSAALFGHGPKQFTKIALHWPFKRLMNYKCRGSTGVLIRDARNHAAAARKAKITAPKSM
jgi:hypothetical protein